jgi:hypothetical protein
LNVGQNVFNDMNLAPTQLFGNKPLRRFCAALSIFVLTAAPALAEPVQINQVVRTVTNSSGITDLKLSTLVSQDPVAPGTKGSQAGPRNETATGLQDGTKTDSLLSGATVTSEGQPLGVEIVEEGEVEGTICDCGEILVAAGSFPKWTLLFLAAVPLVFINDCDSCDIPSSNPTPTPPSAPTPPPTPTPEPASLLLFGSGLLAAGAGLRRRYTKSKPEADSTAREEE